MFPTFTGSSRKARNVNLSGQKAINPFTSTSWAPHSAAGASKTVANAQAERQQRQQERDRQKAARRIQKSWRGHRVRRALRAERRRIIDRLYEEQVSMDVAQRTVEAIPLVLSVYQASHPDDIQRLSLLARDLLQTRFAAFVSGAIEAPRLSKLASIVVASLGRILYLDHACSQVQTLLETAVEVSRVRPQSLQPVLQQYYRTLGKYCHKLGPASHFLDLIRRALVTPLLASNAPESFTQASYFEFASSFLTQPDLFLFESNAGFFAADIDVDHLSDSLLARLSTETRTPGSQESLMWLLAHFVDLQNKRKQQVLHSRSLRALYSLLSAISDQVRAGFAPLDMRDSVESDGVEDLGGQTLPPYVSDKLASLTDRDEISRLLEKFTSERGITSESELEDAASLAGYVLTLVYCFPTLSDDIRMRLYLADVPTQHGSIPAVKFFWNASSKASAFSNIVSDGDSALRILRQRHSPQLATAPEADSLWHREWRTILLFLELYVFVLRLTDDDDFFSSLGSGASFGGSGSRLRSSCLQLEDLKRLTLFLKHLGFALYYHSTELLGSTGGVVDASNSFDGVLSSSSRPRSRGGGSQASAAPRFVLTAGVGFDAFRSLVSTAMRMIYERDSRRQFLPHQHWLMTSKFDMEGFLSAVILEEQRQRELAESGGEDEGDGSDQDEPLSFTLQGQRRSRQAQLEKLRVMRKRDARERLRAATAPKLEVLRNMPFVIPFDMRVQIFRQFVHLDKHRRRGGNIDPDRWRLGLLAQHGGLSLHGDRDILSRHKASIKRGRLFPDAMDAFWDLAEGLKEPIQISFVDEFGMEEAGIDGGGVTKEFLISVTTEAFTQDQRLFITNSKNAYYPNPWAVDQQKHVLREAGVREDSDVWRESITDLLHQYEFLGRIIGKCLYEGILIDIVFAGFFLLKWASSGADTYRANINDLRELDEELYQGMLRLKDYPDVSDLSLDFTITDQVSLPNQPIRTVTRNLVPNGENVAVTNENRPLYISYVARHRLVAQPYAQTRAFLRGLGMIIDPAWLSMFNQNELQRLVGGDSSEIDVEDLRRHTMYSGVYAIGDDGQEHPTVRLFWEVMHDLKDHERRDVLKYVTSTPRAPLLGFSQLKPPFSIRDGGMDQDRLPSASTCVNLLKLPQYKSAAVLKSKLLYAVTSGAGFDLS
ncbi:putative E3 ubiquitin-protein ligase HUL5 [Madurella mycetomatis]|uniref:HECT-type E3 ubiquitin transferase n=1 Tax=Madurella mycetomatis TaxID=100816 RepID=A0A175VXP2_9PEZI|nr:putative E3 ubiquitin-protein ligase HUL5 [Madurella mycetomatis]